MRDRLGRGGDHRGARAGPAGPRGRGARGRRLPGRGREPGPGPRQARAGHRPRSARAGAPASPGWHHHAVGRSLRPAAGDRLRASRLDPRQRLADRPRHPAPVLRARARVLRARRVRVRRHRGSPRRRAVRGRRPAEPSGGRGALALEPAGELLAALPRAARAGRPGACVPPFDRHASRPRPGGRRRGARGGGRRAGTPVRGRGTRLRAGRRRPRVGTAAARLERADTGRDRQRARPGRPLLHDASGGRGGPGGAHRLRHRGGGRRLPAHPRRGLLPAHDAAPGRCSPRARPAQPRRRALVSGARRSDALRRAAVHVRPRPGRDGAWARGLEVHGDPPPLQRDRGRARARGERGARPPGRRQLRRDVGAQALALQAHPPLLHDQPRVRA